MVENLPAPRRHAAQSKEAKAAAKELNALIERRIRELTEETDKRIAEISEETGKSIVWLETQFYEGGKLLKNQRAVNSFNAALSQAAKQRKEQGLPSLGKQTVAILSSELAASGEWRDASEEDINKMKKELEAKRQSKLKRVSDKMVGHEIETTMSAVESTIHNLSKRAHTDYLLLTLHSVVTDTWATCICASPRVKDALFQLHKQTEDVFALKLQAYITSGLVGVLKMTKENVASTLRLLIRSDITKGLHDILTHERDITADELPRMEWARHVKQTVDYGVELTGWTDPEGIRNVEALKSIAQLQKLKNAIDKGECVWVALTDEEWDARKEAYRQAVGTKSATKRKRKGKKKAGEDEDEESDEEGEQERVRRNQDTHPFQNQASDFAASFQPPFAPGMPMMPMPPMVLLFPISLCPGWTCHLV